MARKLSHDKPRKQELQRSLRLEQLATRMLMAGDCCDQPAPPPDDSAPPPVLRIEFQSPDEQASQIVKRIIESLSDPDVQAFLRDIAQTTAQDGVPFDNVKVFEIDLSEGNANSNPSEGKSDKSEVKAPAIFEPLDLMITPRIVIQEESAPS